MLGRGIGRRFVLPRMGLAKVKVRVKVRVMRVVKTAVDAED